MKSLHHWCPCLGWTKEPFTILTDHASLTYWKALRNLNRRTARWHTDLQEYNFEIVHIPGKTNTMADTLSRPSDADQGGNNNQNITLIPPTHCRTVSTIEQPSNQLLWTIMALIHSHPTTSHPEHNKTIRKARQVQCWPNMNSWIAEYIKGCAICQQNKILTHPKKTPLYKITTITNACPFQQVTMDLITSLPPQNGKDAILTIIDYKCSWVAIFLPCHMTIMGLGIAQLYLHNIYRWFRLPIKIIMDRDPRFTSQFGKALMKRLGIS
jgi:hypothetical protein